MTSVRPTAAVSSLDPMTDPASWSARHVDLLRSCERRWGLTVTEQLTDQQSVARFRVKVRGREAVLKLHADPDEARRQGVVLEAARGEGYVHLYDRDDALGALLLEPLGPSLREMGEARYADISTPDLLARLHDSELIQPIVETLKLAWQLPHELAVGVHGQQHPAVQLAAQIEGVAATQAEASDHRDAVQRAVLYARQRLSASHDSLLVVCHGDPHPGNLLQVLAARPGAASGFVWVDPAGLLCEPECDLGVVLRGFNSLILQADDPVVTLRGWCAVLAEATDTDAEAIWQWAYIERVAAGLRLLAEGRRERGSLFLKAASWLIARKDNGD